MANYTWMTTTALSATAADFGEEVIDNYFDRNVTMKAIKQYGGIVDRQGGKEFTVPVIKEGGSAQWFTRTTKLSDNMPDPVFTKTYEMAYMQVPIKVYWTDEVENSGSKVKIFDFVKTMQDVATQTAELEIETALWRSVALANSILSLPTIVDTAASEGSCDPATYTWNVAQSSTGGSFASNGLDKMQEMLTTLYQENANIDSLFMYSTIYNYYIKAAEDKHVLMNEGSKLGFGVGKVPFCGIPVEIGKYVPTDEIFFIDFSTIKLRRNSKATIMTDWIDMENEVARKAHLLFSMQLYTNNRRRNGKIVDITS